MAVQTEHNKIQLFLWIIQHPTNKQHTGAASRLNSISMSSLNDGFRVFSNGNNDGSLSHLFFSWFSGAHNGPNPRANPRKIENSIIFSLLVLSSLQHNNNHNRAQQPLNLPNFHSLCMGCSRHCSGAEKNVCDCGTSKNQNWKERKRRLALLKFPIEWHLSFMLDKTASSSSSLWGSWMPTRLPKRG